MMAKTVLVVEDDPILCVAAEEMFVANGFKVKSTNRADHAVKIVAHCAAQTVFLFTDVRTPGSIDGIDLAGIVKRCWPHIEVLVTSGGAVSKERLPEDVRFVPKPWSSKDVVELARAALSTV